MTFANKKSALNRLKLLLDFAWAEARRLKFEFFQDYNPEGMFSSQLLADNLEMSRKLVKTTIPIYIHNTVITNADSNTVFLFIDSVNYKIRGDPHMKSGSWVITCGCTFFEALCEHCYENRIKLLNDLIISELELCPRCRKYHINPTDPGTYSFSITDGITKICNGCSREEVSDYAKEILSTS